MKHRVYETEQAEAAGVADAIKRLIAKTPAEQIAILVRINSATARFERELQAVGIPYTVRGQAVSCNAPRSSVRCPAAGRGQTAGNRRRRRTGGRGPGTRRLHPDPPMGQAQREEWESLAALVGLARSHDSPSPWWPTSTSGPRTTTPPWRLR